jgi:predicted ribonuclease YlaK
MDKLIIVDESFLLRNYKKLFKSFKIFIPNAVIQKIERKSSVNIEEIHNLTEERKRSFHRLCQSHIVKGLLKNNPEKYEIIGSSGTGWVQKIQPFADFFQEKNRLNYFEDQTRTTATLLALQKQHPSTRIIFLSEDDSLREFVKAVFVEFLPNNFLECQGVFGKLPEELREKNSRLIIKKEKKKFIKEVA